MKLLYISANFILLILYHRTYKKLKEEYFRRFNRLPASQIPLFYVWDNLGLTREGLIWSLFTLMVIYLQFGLMVATVIIVLSLLWISYFQYKIYLGRYKRQKLSKLYEVSIKVLGVEYDLIVNYNAFSHSWDYVSIVKKRGRKDCRKRVRLYELQQFYHFLNSYFIDILREENLRPSGHKIYL